MAISNTDITNYITKANAALEVSMLSIIRNTRNGRKLNSAYSCNRFLSAGIDVLGSNHGLTNLQVEIIVQQMIEQGGLNDFNGDPIPYTVIT